MITVCKRYCKLLHPSVSKTSDLTNNYKKKTDGKRSVRKGEPMRFIQKNTKGILLCLVLAIPCWFLGQAVPVVGGPVFGILAGMLITLLLKDKTQFQSGITFVSKKVLQYAVILLGFGLNLSVISESSPCRSSSQRFPPR